MCERCNEADKKIQRYKWLVANMLDRTALEAANQLLAQQEQIKASLHPKPDK